MTQTLVSSHSKEVVIGFDRPFCVIGERINPTGRKRLAAEMAAGDYATVEADALAQVAAGALEASLAELDRTMRSITALAQTLESQPNALVFPREQMKDPEPPAGSP